MEVRWWAYHAIAQAELRPRHLDYDSPLDRGSFSDSSQAESKAFFFEKKKQKAFVPAVADS